MQEHHRDETRYRRPGEMGPQGVRDRGAEDDSERDGGSPIEPSSLALYGFELAPELVAKQQTEDAVVDGEPDQRYGAHELQMLTVGQIPEEATQHVLRIAYQRG